MSLRKLREMKMIVNGHVEGSNGSHSEVKKYVKENDIKGVCQE